MTYNYVYNGDGQMVIEATGTITTVYIGGIYEYVISGAEVITRSYYYAGSQRVAMREGGELFFLLGDHLGSTSLTLDASGNKVAEQRYKPWGEIRYSFGLQVTDYEFTGQRSRVEYFGLLYFNARWYDSRLGRFAQADTIVPSIGNPMGWDRYTYSLNNALRYIDPSGHFCVETGHGQTCSDDDDMSKLRPFSPEERKMIYLITIVKVKFGITLSKGDKEWGLANCQLAYDSLLTYNRILGGQLKSLVGGGTWELYEYTGDFSYGGRAALTNIRFYTLGSDPIRQMNMFHEFGHTVNSLPGMDNEFSNALAAINDPVFIGADGYIATEALYHARDYDPNHGTAPAIQASAGTDLEAIADILANYTIGNINMGSFEGREMHSFITGELNRNRWGLTPISQTPY